MTGLRLPACLLAALALCLQSAAATGPFGLAMTPPMGCE
jgi:hypothetical protein